jgi:hypothetical protein
MKTKYESVKITKKTYLVGKKIKKAEGRSFIESVERAVLFYYKTFVEK